MTAPQYLIHTNNCSKPVSMRVCGVRAVLLRCIQEGIKRDQETRRALVAAGTIRPAEGRAINDD